MGKTFLIQEVDTTSTSGGSGGGIQGCLSLIFIVGLVYGLGRCAGCEWAMSDAEKSLKTNNGEIGWSVTGSVDEGRYTFKCPPKGVLTKVVGTDFYDAVESSICSAGVHAGAISLEAGGPVTIEVVRKHGLILEGSQRNGVTSESAKTTEERKKNAKAAATAKPKSSADAPADKEDWTDKVFTVVK